MSLMFWTSSIPLSQNIEDYSLSHKQYILATWFVNFISSGVSENFAFPIKCTTVAGYEILDNETVEKSTHTSS